MNKLEKILAQSVTSEMVAEHLTEKEIEETINQIKEEKNSVEKYIQFKEEEIEEHEGYIRNNEMLIARSKEEKKRAITRFKQLDRTEKSFRVALSEIKGKAPSPNEQRAKLIEEAKEYIRTNGKGLKLSVNKKRRTITLDNGEWWFYPSDSVWNKHIAKALAIAFHKSDDAYIYKFSSEAPQPTEIVEGMDVITYESDGSVHMEGRVKEVSKKHSSLISYDKKLYKKNGYPRAIYTSVTFGFKITSDTKAKYKEEEK